jgi:hypothetical protein
MVGAVHPGSKGPMTFLYLLIVQFWESILHVQDLLGPMAMTRDHYRGFLHMYSGSYPKKELDIHHTGGRTLCIGWAVITKIRGSLFTVEKTRRALCSRAGDIPPKCWTQQSPCSPCPRPPLYGNALLPWAFTGHKTIKRLSHLPGVGI